MKKKNLIIYICLFLVLLIGLVSATNSLNKGLIAHWELNENSYNPTTERITDYTPNEYHATNYGATLTTDRFGALNEAMSFDGTSDYISTNYYPDNEPKTLNYWFKYDSSKSTGIGVGVNDGNNRRYYFGYYNYNYFYIGIGNKINNIITLSETLVNGQWYMLTLTTDGSNAKVYLNGVYGGTDTYSFSGTSDLDLYLGIAHVTTGVSTGINGPISDVRIYDYPLTQEEITKLYETNNPKIHVSSLNKGLILHYNMDYDNLDNQSMTITDKTPYEYHGTYSGLSLFSAEEDVLGKPLKAVNFNSVDDYAITSLTTDLSANDFSVSVWLKPNAVSVGNYAVVQGASGVTATSNWIVWAELSNTLFWFKGTTLGSVSGLGAKDGNWHHLVMTWDRSEEKYKGYFDGNYVGQSALVVGYGSTGSVPVKIGIRNDLFTEIKYNGLMDELRIYNRIITQEEVTALYETHDAKLVI